MLLILEKNKLPVLDSKIPDTRKELLWYLQGQYGIPYGDAYAVAMEDKTWIKTPSGGRMVFVPYDFTLP